MELRALIKLCGWRGSSVDPPVSVSPAMALLIHTTMPFFKDPSSSPHAGVMGTL